MAVFATTNSLFPKYLEHSNVDPLREIDPRLISVLKMRVYRTRALFESSISSERKELECFGLRILAPGLQFI